MINSLLIMNYEFFFFHVDKIVELPEIKKLLKGRVKQLEEAAQTFLDGIVGSLKKLPYGIRWICKTISDLARENFK